MESKLIIKAPKFLKLKVFLISLSAALTLWLWGLISTQDLINNAVTNYSPSLGTAVPQSQPSDITVLKKVELPGTPTPVPSSSNYSPQITKPKSLPLTRTGSSRP
jgi:hypothetical protein